MRHDFIQIEKTNRVDLFLDGLISILIIKMHQLSFIITRFYHQNLIPFPVDDLDIIPFRHEFRIFLTHFPHFIFKGIKNLNPVFQPDTIPLSLITHLKI